MQTIHFFLLKTNKQWFKESLCP